jgi:hypothetical protein
MDDIYNPESALWNQLSLVIEKESESQTSEVPIVEDEIENTTDRKRKLRAAFEKVQNNQETSFPSALQFAGLEPNKANEQAVKRLASTPEQKAKLKRANKGRPSKE